MLYSLCHYLARLFSSCYVVRCYTGAGQDWDTLRPAMTEPSFHQVRLSNTRFILVRRLRHLLASEKRDC
jgi:hypothetical protein